MFGYLKIHKSELLVREYEAYKAVYCGLCKQLGKDYSFLARLGLSYDSTFYAILLMSTSKSCSGFGDGRCVFNPLKKCKFAFCESDSYNKAAALTVILAYYKLKDNIADSVFFGRLAAFLPLPIFSLWRKKAAKRYPEIEQIVAEMMNLQYETEHLSEISVDKSAHATAKMLSDIFTLEAKSEEEKQIFSEFGYQLGRWIYFVDAADDFEKDCKHSSFNPFIGFRSDNLKSDIAALLNQTLARAYGAYNLMDIRDFKGILENMLLYGLPLVQNRVLSSFGDGGNNE